MIVLKCEQSFADLRLSQHELVVLSNALNEVCNGVHIEASEFPARLGATPEEVQNLLANLSAAFR